MGRVVRSRLSIGECPLVSSRARARDTLAMLDASDTQTLDTPVTQDSVQTLARRIERMQAELHFEKTRNAARN